MKAPEGQGHGPLLPAFGLAGKNRLVATDAHLPLSEDEFRILPPFCPSEHATERSPRTSARLLTLESGFGTCYFSCHFHSHRFCPGDDSDTSLGQWAAGRPEFADRWLYETLGAFTLTKNSNQPHTHVVSGTIRPKRTDCAHPLVSWACTRFCSADILRRPADPNITKAIGIVASVN